MNLHHFTNPIWFAKKGGWLVSKNIDYFIFYIKKVIERLKNLVDYWLIFNEPLVYVYNSYILGIWPPGKKSFYEAKKVLKNIIKAYILSYQEIKRIYKNKTNSFPKISFTKHLIQFLPCREKNFILNLFSTYFRDKIFNFKILEDLFKKNYLDFLAINYYTKQNIRFGGLLGKECNSYLHNERKNFLGWYVYPDGLFNLLIKLKKFNLPIIITENGTAETQDILYKDYLLLHLKSVHKAILKKVNVKGYLWWSLIDNFEWDKGFGPRFGLIEVNYKTFERKIKPFALVYAKIAKENKIVLNGA